MKGKLISFKGVIFTEAPKRRINRRIVQGEIRCVSPRTKAYIKNLQDLVDFYEKPTLLSNKERIRRQKVVRQLKDHIRKLSKY